MSIYKKNPISALAKDFYCKKLFFSKTYGMKRTQVWKERKEPEKKSGEVMQEIKVEPEKDSV